LEEKVELHLTYMGMAANANFQPCRDHLLLNQDFDHLFASDARFKNLCLNQVPLSRTMSSPTRALWPDMSPYADKTGFMTFP
jgi:hypothetical protein